MITLFLLHPLKKIPVQNWTFENEPVIRIGRSTDNHVVLYSAVVSRHHVELRYKGSQWEIVNLGTNGTYLDGKRITQVTAQDGVIIRLARSGPNIQIRLGTDVQKETQRSVAGEETIGQPSPFLTSGGLSSTVMDESGIQASEAKIPVPPHLQLNPVAFQSESLAALSVPSQTSIQPQPRQDGEPLALRMSTDCQHLRAGPLFCLDCGHPLHPLMAIADYEVLGVLGRGEVGITYWAWNEERSVGLKTLNQDWADHPVAHQAFQQEVDLLYRLEHPQLPRFIDYFQLKGQPYLVMELMFGQTLEEHILTQGPVRESEAAAWMLQVCGVLDYLHQRSPPVLHRGMTPHSLILRSHLDSEAQLAIVDFGAIKTAVLGVEPTSETAVYIAPEIRRGQPEPASDLYALGAILIHLLTRQDPALYYGSRDQGTRLYPEYISGLSTAMTNIIRTLTHPDPGQRYSSATALATDLSAVAGQLV